MLKKSHLLSLIKIADELDKSNNIDKIAIADKIDKLISALPIEKKAVERIHPSIKNFLSQHVPNAFKDLSDTRKGLKELMNLKDTGKYKTELAGVAPQDLANAINMLRKSMEPSKEKVPTYKVGPGYSSKAVK